MASVVWGIPDAAGSRQSAAAGRRSEPDHLPLNRLLAASYPRALRHFGQALPPAPGPRPA